MQFLGNLKVSCLQKPSKFGKISSDVPLGDSVTLWFELSLDVFFRWMAARNVAVRVGAWALVPPQGAAARAVALESLGAGRRCCVRFGAWVLVPPECALAWVLRAECLGARAAAGLHHSVTKTPSTETPSQHERDTIAT